MTSLPEVREIETLYLDMIAAAKRFIYFENQYFTSGKIAAAIAERMAEADPPEIVMVMPRTADGWLEQKAMDAARLKLVAAIGKADTHNRFRVYIPVTKEGTDIYVHAKVSIVDDRLLRVGSSNLNNRSQGLDSECDVIIDAALAANRGSEAAMTALRHRLIAEHLDCAPEEVAAREQGERIDDRGDRGAARRGQDARTARDGRIGRRPGRASPTMKCSTPKAPKRCSSRSASTAWRKAGPRAKR